MIRRWQLIVLLLAFLLVGDHARVQKVRAAGVYAVYLPMVSIALPNSHFALQSGWGTTASRYIQSETAMRLQAGSSGDQHRLIERNMMQTFQVLEWYDWFAQVHPEIDLPIHPCVWSSSSRTLPRAGECAAWISANPGKAWIIGNEPNLGYESGGDYLTPAQYAEMFAQAVTLIRSADSMATIIAAAWVFDPCSSQDNGFTAWQTDYRQMYGAAPSPDVWSMHYYHAVTPDDAEARRQVVCFLGRVGGRVWITELGWYGLDTANNTPSNVDQFMENFLPWLMGQARIEKWFWWEWGSGSVLVRYDGTLTKPGGEYSRLTYGIPY